MVAPVRLPHGVTITEIVGQMADYDSRSPGWSVYVFRKDIDAVPGWRVMAILIATGNGGLQEIHSTDVGDPQIDNTEYVYWARACLRDPDTVLYGLEFHFDA